jgi:hypothetical protein
MTVIIKRREYDGTSKYGLARWTAHLSDLNQCIV